MKRLIFILPLLCLLTSVEASVDSLPVNLIKLPSPTANWVDLKGADVREHEYQVSDRTFGPYDILYTESLASCSGIAIRDQKSGRVLFAHFVAFLFNNQNEIHSYVQELADLFFKDDISSSDVSVTIVWGGQQREHFFWTMESLVQSIKMYISDKVSLDATPTDRERVGFYIEVKSGRMYRSEESYHSKPILLSNGLQSSMIFF